MTIAKELLAVVPDAAPERVTWGIVTATAPFTVRFAGDTSGIVVALRGGAYTPTTNDKVILLRVGTQWVAVDKVVAA